jgi:hypothetical protein
MARVMALLMGAPLPVARETLKRPHFRPSKQNQRDRISSALPSGNPQPKGGIDIGCVYVNAVPRIEAAQSSQEKLRAFHVAMVPRLDEIIQFLNQHPPLV